MVRDAGYRERLKVTITREQFIRGFNAIRLSFGRSTAMNIAALEAGLEDYNHGQDPVAYELQTQLEERCNDTFDDPHVGTAISYGLHECGLVRPRGGAEEFRMDSAEAVWRWWEETKTGPFRPIPLKRYDLVGEETDDGDGAEFYLEESERGEWVKLSDVEPMLLGAVSS